MQSRSLKEVGQEVVHAQKGLHNDTVQDVTIVGIDIQRWKQLYSKSRE